MQKYTLPFTMCYCCWIQFNWEIYSVWCKSNIMIHQQESYRWWVMERKLLCNDQKTQYFSSLRHYHAPQETHSSSRSRLNWFSPSQRWWQCIKQEPLWIATTSPMQHTQCTQLTQTNKRNNDQLSCERMHYPRKELIFIFQLYLSKFLNLLAFLDFRKINKKSCNLESGKYSSGVEA